MIACCSSLVRGTVSKSHAFSNYPHYNLISLYLKSIKNPVTTTIEGVFLVDEPRPGRVFVPFHKHGWNKESSQCTGDQAAIETADFFGRTGSEEDQDGSVSQNSHMTVFRNAWVEIHINFLRNRRTIIWEHCDHLLDRFGNNLKKKQQVKLWFEE